MAKTVRYYIDVDESGAIRGGKNVEKQLGDVDQASQKTGASSVALGNIMADAAMKMVGSLAQVVSQSQELFSRQEQAEQKVQAVIKATSGAAGFGVEELKGYASELQQYTTIGDESFLESMSTLLTFRKVTGDTFKQAIELSADTAQIFGSLESATLQIGKALEDPIEGMTALRRVGVTFSEQQKESVKDFLAQNDLASAQAVILDNLRGQVGGVAREMSKTPTGQWEQFMNTVGDSQEDFGEIITRLKVGMIPVFERLLSIGDDVVSTLGELVGLDLASRLNDERMEMNALVFSITSLNEGNETRSELITELLQKYPEFIGKIDAEKTTNEDLRSALEEVNKLYIDRAAVQIATAQQEDAIAAAGKALIDQKNKESAAYQKLISLNENYGLGIDLSTGSIQENLNATRSALVEKGKWTESATLGRIAVNDEARAASDLIGIQNELVVALNKVTEAQENVVEAAEFRKIVEESLTPGEDAVPIIPIVYDIPERPTIPNIEPVHVPIEFELPEFEPFDLSHELLSDGSIETLNKQLAQVDLLPDNSINDLELKLGMVNELHSAAQTDAERERLAIAQEGIELQLEARRTGLSEEQIMQQEHNQIIKQQLTDGIGVAMGLYSQLTALSQAQTQAELASIDKEKKARLKAIDEQLKNESLSEKEREKLLAQREQVEKQYEARETAVKKEQFEKDKKAKQLLAIAETAVAVVEALPNIPLSIAAGVAGALQVAIIASQPNPYYDGGPILERMPTGMTSPGKKIISINETPDPEYVINGMSTKRFMPVLDLINYQPEIAEQVLSPIFSTPNVTAELSPFELLGNIVNHSAEYNDEASAFEFGGAVNNVSSTSIDDITLNALPNRGLEIPTIESISTQGINEAILEGFEKLSIRLDVDGGNRLVEYIESVQRKTSKDVITA